MNVAALEAPAKNIVLRIQYPSGLSRILVHLRNERIEGLEALLVAQLGDELNLDPPAVQISVEVEQMRLEQRLAAAHGWPRTEARDAGKPLRPHTAHTHCKDARERRSASLQAQIGRCKSQPAPEMQALDDAAAHAVWTTQPALGLPQITLRENLTNTAAAHPRTIDHERRDDIDRGPESRRDLLEQRHGRLAVASESKIVTHDDDRRAEILEQQSRELLAGQAPHPLAEAQQPQVLETHAAQQLPALPPGREARRRRAGAQMLPRQWLEREDHRGPRQPRAVLSQPLEQRLVAKVDAIVAADGDGASALALPQVTESTNEPHELKAGAAATVLKRPSIGKNRSSGGARAARANVDIDSSDPQTTAPFTATLAETFVANTKSAEKAALQAEKHRMRNVALRSRMRTVVRKVTAAVAAGNKEAAESSYREAVPVIDTLVNKQIVHRNKAARHKSRLAARIRAMH